MPRPPEGYLNAAGQQVPGVSDIIKAYIPKPALVQWAARRCYEQGRAGLPMQLYEKGTLDIGTAVHAMAELDLKGRPSKEIDQKVHELLHEPHHVAKAWLAFNAFCDWRERCAVRSIAHEVNLVSEQYQLGGTPDCIAYVDGAVGLIDFKTCNKVPDTPYYEQLMAMSAHAALWNDAHPDQRIGACHVIYLPKDGGAPAHHAYADLSPQWREFRCLLSAYQERTGSPKPAEVRPAGLKPAAPVDLREAAIAKVKAAAAAARKRPRTVKAAPKERLAEAPPVVALPPPPPPQPMSMAELLRAYGHVRN